MRESTHSIEFDADRWSAHPIWTQCTWDVLVMPDCGLDLAHFTVRFITEDSWTRFELDT